MKAATSKTMVTHRRENKKAEKRCPMGWAIWNKEMDEEFQDERCEYCKNPMALGDKYYTLGDNPLRVGHAECVWKAVDEAAKKKGL